MKRICIFVLLALMLTVVGPSTSGSHSSSPAQCTAQSPITAPLGTQAPRIIAEPGPVECGISIPLCTTTPCHAYIIQVQVTSLGSAGTGATNAYVSGYLGGSLSCATSLGPATVELGTCSATTDADQPFWENPYAGVTLPCEGFVNFGDFSSVNVGTIEIKCTRIQVA